jgi:ParB-like chromosome segregation protein Spo0J
MTEAVNNPATTPATGSDDTKVAPVESKAPVKGKAAPAAKSKAPAKGKAPAAKTPRTPKVKEPVNYGPYTAHSAADVFPLMSPAMLAELAEDIKAHGLLEPVIIHERQILDGRNRWLASEKAGVRVEDIKVRKFSPADDQTVAEWVVSKNIKRRHLTPSQINMLGAKLTELIKVEVEANRRASQAATQAETKGANRADLPAQSGDSGHKTADRAAKASGGSSRGIRQAQRVRREAPELAERVEAGTMSLDAAEREIKGPESVVTTADKLLTDLWRVIRAVKDDIPLREAFDWALGEDPALREALAELINIKNLNGGE